MNLGWISLYRKIQDHWIWEDPIKLKCWLDLLFMVNHSTQKVNIDYDLISVEKGSKITSINKLSVRWNMTRKRVGKFLDLLEKDEMIVQKRNNRFTMITICNYNAYQDNGSAGGTTDDTATEHQTHNKGSNRGNTNNNDNKENNVNNENNISCSTKVENKNKCRKQLPHDFVLTEERREYCIKNSSGRPVCDIWTDFITYHRSRGTTMLDWHAAWQNWCRNDKKFNFKNQNSRGQPLTIHEKNIDETVKFIERRMQQDD